ncbi:MAG: TetR/AcrR family transcriptional regulator [Bifidobacteriaceae bacterium]|nr:TetR/AcrR family transcriptional regulator [Bifidobacteriaceae bacterium]
MTTPDRSKEFQAALRDLGAAAKALADSAGEQVADSAPRVTASVAAKLRRAADAIAPKHVSPDEASGQTASTRLALIGAAIRVIARKGYSAASMDDVAAAAGYTKGAIYSQFGSKEDLFVEVTASVLNVERPLPLPGGLSGAMSAAQATADPSRSAVILEALALSLRSPSFAVRVKPAFEAAAAAIARQIAADQGVPEELAVKFSPRDFDTAIALFTLSTAGPAVTANVLPENDPAAPKTFSNLASRLLTPPVER